VWGVSSAALAVGDELDDCVFDTQINYRPDGITIHSTSIQGYGNFYTASGFKPKAIDQTIEEKGEINETRFT
jgi:hypothetical protein